MGTRLRRLFALLIVVVVLARAIRSLRGGPTRAFDRPLGPVRRDDPTPTREAPTHPAWVAPTEGSCPAGHAIKANLRSGIFHLPGMSAYDRTNPDRCYAEAEGALADGLRVAKR